MEDTTKPLNKVIRIDESEIRGHLDEMVRGTVEETLKAMLDNGLEIATTLLAFTLAIFVILVFGVRLLMVVRIMRSASSASQMSPLG